ncbi:MAG TPA: Mov34/MPN/PAD-1 family protein [Ktedonobacteraceae bacterium]|jgi:proteasome lid subunit RPN8/RPN11
MKRKRAARVLLATPAWKTMLLDVYARQEIEACGALLGTIDQQGNWRVTEALPLRNVYASPVYFEFEPAELLAVDLEHPGSMIGVYHSHPAGPTMASATDRQNMQRVNIEQHIPWVWLILSGPFTSASPAGLPDEDKMTLRGLIAYHHYPDIGLQHIPIQRALPPAPGS